MDLSETEKHLEDLEVVIIFNVLISYLIALLALLKTVVVLHEISNDLRKRTTLNTNKVERWRRLWGNLLWLPCAIRNLLSE